MAAPYDVWAQGLGQLAAQTCLYSMVLRCYVVSSMVGKHVKVCWIENGLKQNGLKYATTGSTDGFEVKTSARGPMRTIKNYHAANPRPSQATKLTLSRDVKSNHP